MHVSVLCVVPNRRGRGVQNFWLPRPSVGGAERKTGLKHFDSKWIIEEYIRSLGLPATMRETGW